MDNKECEESDIYAQISSLLLQDGGAGQCEFRGEITGGIINKAGLFNVNGKETFVKYATRQNAFRMFSSEKESLRLIQKTNIIRVPHPGEVFSLPVSGGACFVLEYLPGLSPVSTEWAALGEKLARLHKYNLDLISKASTNSSIHKGDDAPVRRFGFDHPVYIGSAYVVEPVWEDDWLTYFIRYHLKSHLEAIEQKTGHAEFREIWSELQLTFHKPFNEIKVSPSIIHGDFCTINIGQWQGQPVLYDPGCYYGHSEVDFIIPAMENNFPPEYFEAYFNVLPKESKGFEERQALYVFSAYCMIHVQQLIKDDQSFRQAAIDSGKHLLQLLQQYY